MCASFTQPAYRSFPSGKINKKDFLKSTGQQTHDLSVNANFFGFKIFITLEAHKFLLNANFLDQLVFFLSSVLKCIYRTGKLWKYFSLLITLYKKWPAFFASF